MIDWGIGFPSLDPTNLSASGHPIWTPATHWDLLRTFKLQTHIKALGREHSAGAGWSSQRVVIPRLVGLTWWFSLESTPYAFELNMGMALVDFVTFSRLSKCHCELITSNHA